MIRKKNNRYRSSRNRGFIRRMLKGLLLLVFTTGGVVLLSAALAHAYFALLEAPWLRIDEIQINGTRHVDRAQILNAMQVPRGANFLNLRIGQVAQRLEALPWLKAAVVRYDHPGRIVVEVVEREPIAIVYADDFYLLDREGRLFAQTTIEQNPGMLLITGFSGSGLTRGSKLPSTPFESLTELLAALEKSQGWLPYQLISECRWSGDGGFILYTAQRAIPIQLGSEGFELKLYRLQRLLGMLMERQWLDLVSRIDLDYANRAFVEGRFPTSKGI